MACSSDPIERRSQKGALYSPLLQPSTQLDAEVSVEAQQGSLEARARGPYFQVVESCIRARGWRERQLVTVTGI
jgi:hypothetical protein